MRLSSLHEIKTLASKASNAIWDIATSQNRLPKIYLLWTNDEYGRFDEDSHINIDRDGNYYLSCESLTEAKGHSDSRNAGSISIVLACAKDAAVDNIGQYPPTLNQIKAMAAAVAALADALGITIDKQNVLTGGEAAANEDGLYLSSCCALWHNDTDRPGIWDLEYLGNVESPVYNPDAMDGSRGGDVIRNQAVWYKEQKGNG